MATWVTRIGPLLTSSALFGARTQQDGRSAQGGPSLDGQQLEELREQCWGPWCGGRGVQNSREWDWRGRWPGMGMGDGLRRGQGGQQPGGSGEPGRAQLGMPETWQGAVPGGLEPGAQEGG